MTTTPTFTPRELAVLRLLAVRAEGDGIATDIDAAGSANAYTLARVLEKLEAHVDSTLDLFTPPPTHLRYAVMLDDPDDQHGGVRYLTSYDELADAEVYCAFAHDRYRELAELSDEHPPAVWVRDQLASREQRDVRRPQAVPCMACGSTNPGDPDCDCYV